MINTKLTFVSYDKNMRFFIYIQRFNFKEVKSRNFPQNDFIFEL